MTYNGWKNYETWNVALWIGNDEWLYEQARTSRDYEHFVTAAVVLQGEFGEDAHFATGTPDGVSWDDPGLDIEALDELIRELHGEAVSD